MQGKLRELPPGSAGKKGGSNSARAGESGLVRLDIQMLTSWACRTDANMHGSDEFGRAESAACGTGQLDGGIDETGQPCMTFAASAAFVGQLAPEWTGNSDQQVPDGGAAIKTGCPRWLTSALTEAGQNPSSSRAAGLAVSSPSCHSLSVLATCS